MAVGAYEAARIRFVVSPNDLVPTLLLLIGIALRPSTTSTTPTTRPPQTATIPTMSIYPSIPPAEAPPPSHPASSLGGGPPTTSQTPLGGTSGMLLVGVGAGIIVVLLNVFVIGCCLHKRNEKRLKRGEGIRFHRESCGCCCCCCCHTGRNDIGSILDFIFYQRWIVR